MRYFFALGLLLLLAGCAPLATFQLSPEVDMEVYSVSADATSYSASIKFVERTPYPEVIQEGWLIREQQQFIEKFPANDRTHTDRHWASSARMPGIQRVFKVYVGQTEGTLDTLIGFAMLPQNKDGSLVTNTGADFNSSYRKTRPLLAGKVVSCSDVAGWWFIEWSPNRLVLATSSGRIIFNAGEVSVKRP